MVEKGADVNEVVIGGGKEISMTPVFFTVHERQLEALKWLLDNGADGRMKTGSGQNLVAYSMFVHGEGWDELDGLLQDSVPNYLPPPHLGSLVGEGTPLRPSGIKRSQGVLRGTTRINAFCAVENMKLYKNTYEYLLLYIDPYITSLLAPRMGPRWHTRVGYCEHWCVGAMIYSQR